MEVNIQEAARIRVVSEIRIDQQAKEGGWGIQKISRGRQFLDERGIDGNILSNPTEYLENLSTTWKAFLSYFLVDQSFALSHKFFKENNSLENKHYYLLGSGATLWLVWQISSLFGIQKSAYLLYSNY